MGLYMAPHPPITPHTLMNTIMGASCVASPSSSRTPSRRGPFFSTHTHICTYIYIKPHTYISLLHTQVIKTP
ncbi:hypothetical protein HanRHA438_Chr15g0706491 [Helianthus annuus]|nr:hypothetical protein HanRHA438_Chr15g0706491 [Helianthus annuus]